MKLLVLLALCVCISAFRPLGSRANVKSSLYMASDYDALQNKLVSKTAAPAKKVSASAKVAKTTATPASSIKAAPVKKEVKLELVENPRPKKVIGETKAAAPTATTKAAPIAPAKTKAGAVPPAPKKVETAPVKAAAPVKVVPPAPKKAEPVAAAPVKVVTPSYTPSATTELSGGEVAAGVGLGLAPYLLIPVVLASGVKGLLKKPAKTKKEVLGMDAIAKGGLRRNPAEGDAVLPRSKQFDKPLSEGAKEGIAELLSGNADQGSKNGLKLIAGSFGLSAVGLVALFALGQKPEPAP